MIVFLLCVYYHKGMHDIDKRAESVHPEINI